MEDIGGEQLGQRTSVRQVALASFIGSTVEWYDFFLYRRRSSLDFDR
jgi:MFS transporter, MHS family, shikimate and dehydroshikimate transport protein